MKNLTIYLFFMNAVRDIACLTARNRLFQRAATLL